MTGPLVSVAVPMGVDRAFTYRLPQEVGAASPGCRVLVPFGSRAVVGVVRAAEPSEAPPDRIRAVLGVLDPPRSPALGRELLELAEWMSDYYLAPVGEVVRAMLPGLLTRADARVVRLTSEGRAAVEAHQVGPLLAGDVAGPVDLDRAPHLARLLAAVAAGPAAGVPIPRLMRTKPALPRPLALVAQAQEAGLLTLDWAEERAARTELHVRRTDYLRGADVDEAELQRAVGRSKQRRALLDYLEGVTSGKEGTGEDGWIDLATVRGPFPRARQLLGPLVEAGLVVTEERARRLDPFALDTPEPSQAQPPTEDQARALRELGAALDTGTFRAALLEGITGSGKTEVYLQLIAQARATGGGAIVLVPEIALTPQLASRFRARFGEEVAVLHSGLTPAGRYDAWHQIRTGERPIVIGARSAIFAPVPNLRVVVVDEEHDPSFKQEDGVRYHARDVALVRAKAAGAVVVLGSATPSLESFYNASRGRYLHLHLRTRPTPRPLPTVEILPLAIHRPDPRSLLSARLKEALRETVAAGEQAILFLNRRGFATGMQCDTCGAFVQCPDCSGASMTYHLGRNRLLCHLCGYVASVPERCPSCDEGSMVHGGAGTERVEVALSAQLPGIRVLRLDRDSARGQGLARTLERFRRREADVLVGTQMLSKGHDFPGVTLVGVLRGDHGLGLPDPRAAERTFALLTQVAGRAGRGERPGRVLIQAFAVHHPAIEFARAHDYRGFARRELEQRDAANNPPYGHLALVRIQGPDEDAVQQRAELLAEGLRARADEPVQVLGPVPAPIARLNRKVRWQVLLRSRDRPALRALLRRLRPALGPGPGRTQAMVDVDPQNLL